MPSESTWHKLSNQLDEEEGKSNRIKFWWLGIAASLVGILLVTISFLTKDDNLIIAPTLVETPDEEIIKEEVGISDTNQLLSTEDITAKEESGLSIQTENNEAIFTSTKKNSKPNLDKINPINQYLVAESGNINDETVPGHKDAKDIIARNLNSDLELEITLTDNTQKKSLVTDSEIEVLLENARKELDFSKIEIENTETVDAAALLNDVETDLEESFRDKVFKTIISSYKTVKTAVAERND